MADDSARTVRPSAPASTWDQFFAAFTQFVDREGHANVPRSHEERVGDVDVKVGQWLHRQRKAKSAGKLSVEQIAALDGVQGWSWDPAADTWSRHFRALEQFLSREGHVAVPQAHTEEYDGVVLNLGRWANDQRTKHAKGRLAEDRSELLDVLPGWEWNAKNAVWRFSYEAACQFAFREGHARIPNGHVESFAGRDINLGKWAKDQRTQQNTGKLSDERQELLEALPGWSWGPRDSFWRDSYVAACQFGEREGHTRTPNGHKEVVEGREFKLAQWFKDQRVDKKAGELSPERIKLLEDLPGWRW